MKLLEEEAIELAGIVTSAWFSVWAWKIDQNFDRFVCQACDFMALRSLLCPIQELPCRAPILGQVLVLCHNVPKCTAAHYAVLVGRRHLGYYREPEQLREVKRRDHDNPRHFAIHKSDMTPPGTCKDTKGVAYTDYSWPSQGALLSRLITNHHS